MRLSKLTIRARLSLLLAVLSVLILMALSAFIYVFTLDYRKREFRQRLTSRLQEADSLLRKNPGYPFMTLDNLPPGTLPNEAFYYRRPTPMVTVPRGNGQEVLAPLTAVERQQFYFTERDGRSYLLHFDKALGHVIVLSAEDVWGETKMENLQRVLLAGVLFGSLAMGFLSWYLPRRELQPLAEKIRRARTIGGESLNLRLNVRNEHDELGQLAITFNQMLDRIEKAFAAQRQFTSNAAHELRNPITAISGEAQWALLHNRQPSEYQEALQRIKHKSDELERLVERLLVLSKIESRAVEKIVVRLDEILLASVGPLQTRYPAQAKQMRLTIAESDGDSYRVHGDAAMLQIAVGNVLDNALKYGNNKPVSVVLSVTGRDVWLTVSDEGMGVSEEDRERLFELFFRTNQVRHIQGTGIGLPLVKSIVEWHGGRIGVQPNQPCGLKLTLQFPVASANG